MSLGRRYIVSDKAKQEGKSAVRYPRPSRLSHSAGELASETRLFPSTLTYASSLAFSSSKNVTVFVKLVGHEMGNGQSFRIAMSTRSIRIPNSISIAYSIYNRTYFQISTGSPCTPSKQAKKTHGNTAGYIGYQVFGYSEAFSFNHKFINASEHIGRTNNYG